jgi:hypothetical protein
VVADVENMATMIVTVMKMVIAIVMVDVIVKVKFPLHI